MTLEFLVSILVWEVAMQALIFTYAVWFVAVLLALAYASVGLGVAIVTAGQIIAWLMSQTTRRG